MLKTLKLLTPAALMLVPWTVEATAPTCPAPNRKTVCPGDDDLTKPITCRVEVRVEKDQVCLTNGDSVAVRKGDTIIWVISSDDPEDKRTVSIENFRIENTADSTEPPLIKEPCSVTARSANKEFGCVVGMAVGEEQPAMLFKYDVLVRGGSAPLKVSAAACVPRGGKGC